jgi:phage internal scaffolding protein
MSTVFVRSPYNYDMSVVSLETGLLCEDDSLAIQSARDECDINTIVKRFGLTGELPSDFDMPQSGDFTGVGDYHSAMNLVRSAQEQFLRVPAAVRARFHNDPAEFMSFIDDDANRPEAVRLGLVVSRETISTSAAPAVAAA